MTNPSVSTTISASKSFGTFENYILFYYQHVQAAH